MTIKQEGQVTLHDDAEYMSTPHDIAGQPATPSSNDIIDLIGETDAEYNEEATIQRDLTQLQKLFE